MTSPSNYTFIGNTRIGNNSISSNVVESIKYWIDISFLSDGACDTINKDETDYSGKNIGALTPVSDRVYGDGFVYQSYFKNWVWEEDISKEYDFEDIVVCSGIWIGSDFHSKQASGDLYFSIDYRNGRVVFENQNAVENAYGASGVNEVVAEFSYKRVYVVTETELVRSFAESESMNNPIGSGDNLLNEDKIPLPAIIVSENNHSWRGYQLGGGKICSHSINVDVFSHDDDLGGSIIDILSQQENKKVPSVDWSLCESSFDWMGDINPAFSGVYDIATIYKWKDMDLLTANGVKQATGIRTGFVEFLVDSYPHK